MNLIEKRVGGMKEMINIFKILNTILNRKSLEEKYEEKNYNYQEIEKINNKSEGEMLVELFNKEDDESIPEDFKYKVEYFEKGRRIYKKIGKNKYLKELKIVKALDGAGETKVNTNNGKPEIIISIAASKIIYTNDDGKEFCDILAHELFHAQSVTSIIENLGLEEYMNIHNLKNNWSKIAYVIFDEYYACKKNAELFQSFESVESIEGIRKKMSWLNAVCNSDDKINTNLSAIYQLFYNISTLNAFEDVSKEKEEECMMVATEIREIMEKTRMLLNEYYCKVPLRAEEYEVMGCKFYNIFKSCIMSK